MPATIALNPSYGWDYFSLTSSVQPANITYSADGGTVTQKYYWANDYFEA